MNGRREVGVDVREAARLRERGEAVVLDVREPKEWRAGHIPDAIWIPMDDLADRLGELPREARIVTVCRSGRRSGAVAEALRASGYRADNVEGGMKEWSAAGLPLDPPHGRIA